MTAPARSRRHDSLYTVQCKLNSELGIAYWREYVSAAFWSNVSTPVSLALTVMTALTTAHATSCVLSDGAYLDVSVAALLLSTLNTFFKPSTKMAEALEGMTLIRKVGSSFEEVYYDSAAQITSPQERFEAFRRIQAELNTVRNSKAGRNAFLTDLIFACSRVCCLGGGRDRWIHDEP